MKIPERQAQLDKLTRKYLMDPEPAPNGNGHSVSSARSDAEILGLCRRAKNTAKFADLYDAGDTQRYHNGDDSRADYALACMFTFYTQNHAQIERLISGSALGQRPKWKNRTDYRRRTIDKALSSVRETYSEPQFLVRSRSQSLGSEVVSSDPEQGIRAVSFRGREKPGPREWIVDRAICKGHPASWYGESGIAKSLLAAHMGIHIAADGVDYWAGLCVQTTPVIYGDFELDEIEHLRRAQELTAGMGLPDVPTKFHYLPLAGLPAAEAFDIAAKECRRLGAGLFIVDSVGFALDGDSELAKDVLRFYRECIQPIRNSGATPFLIDHQAKVIKGEKYSDKQEFGSVYKTNAVRSSFQIRGSWDGNELTATFTHKKTNFGPKVDDLSLKLVFGAERIEVTRLADAVPNPDREPSKKERVFVAVEELGRATSETVARKTGINPLTVRNGISELLAEGLLVDTGEKQGRFRIVATHSHTTKGPGPGPTAEPVSRHLVPGESGTVEQLQRIDKLVDEGMSESLAREEVLGTGTTDEDDLLSAEPKVVSIESGEPYDVYVGRGKRGTGLKKSKWSNPYVVGKDGTRDECLEKFETYLKASPLMEDLPEIRGKTLACHCAPQPCHADILLRLANSNVSGDSSAAGHPKDCLCRECLPL